MKVVYLHFPPSKKDAKRIKSFMKFVRERINDTYTLGNSDETQMVIFERRAKDLETRAARLLGLVDVWMEKRDK